MRCLDDRHYLYHLMWSKPAQEVASDLDVSEQILIARCIEFQIPRPLNGYWRAVATGNPPAIPPLPPLKAHINDSNDDQEEVSRVGVVNEQPASAPHKLALKGRAKSLSHPAQGAKLFFASKEILLKAQVTQLGYFKPTKRKLMDVNASDTGLSDAESFLLKFLAAVEKNGFRVRLAEMGEGLRRRDIIVSENGSREYLYPSLWKPSGPSVISAEGVSVGFSLVEMTEEVPTKQVKGRFVRDEKMINWSRSKNSADLGYYSRRHIPCGRFRFQLYSPYEPEGWHQVFTQTKNCGLISQIPKMIKVAQSAVPIMRKEIQAQKERAEAQRKRIELQLIEYEKREAIRRKEEAYKESIAELQGIMTRWAEDMRVGQFFIDAEKDKANCDPVLQEKLKERLRAAKELMQGETALQLLLKWRTPEERLK